MNKKKFIKNIVITNLLLSFTLLESCNFNNLAPLVNTNSLTSNNSKTFKIKADTCIQSLNLSKRIIVPNSVSGSSITISGNIDVHSITDGLKDSSNQGITTVRIQIEGVKTIDNVALASDSNVCTNSTNFKSFNYVWDGKDASGNILPEGSYTIRILRPETSNSQNTISPSVKVYARFGLSTTFQVTNDPIAVASQHFFKPDEIRLLLPKVAAVTINTYQGEQLSGTAEQIIAIKQKIDLLKNRPTPDTINDAKISQLQSQLSTLE